jgi:hypothetical protein
VVDEPPHLDFLEADGSLLVMLTRGRPSARPGSAGDGDDG